MPDDIETLTREHAFEDATFDGLDLEGFDLSGKELVRCTFRRCKLMESVWRRATLEDCIFEDCDMTRSVVAWARFRDVVFTRSRLMGCDFTDVAKNPVIHFEGCDLRYISFVRTNLLKSRFVECRMVEANFIGCNLAETDFSGAILSGASFVDSDLTRADLSTAVDAFIDPSRNKVKGLEIAVESAVLLAMSHGMRVLGHGKEIETEAPSPAKRARKR